MSDVIIDFKIKQTEDLINVSSDDIREAYREGGKAEVMSMIQEILLEDIRECPLSYFNLTVVLSDESLQEIKDEKV